jgi:hypothetical protein
MDPRLRARDGLHCPCAGSPSAFRCRAAAHRAYVAVGHIVQKQAFILAFSDTFHLLGVALIATALLKKPSAGEAH